MVQNLRIEIVLAQKLRLYVLHLRDIEQHATVLDHLPSLVADNKAVFQRVNNRAIPPQQRQFVVSQTTELIQCARGKLAVCRFEI